MSSRPASRCGSWSRFGFFDFVALERQAFCVLSDSGTVQEECAIFGVPNVTLRDVTERPETWSAAATSWQVSSRTASWLRLTR